MIVKEKFDIEQRLSHNDFLTFLNHARSFSIGFNYIRKEWRIRGDFSEAQEAFQILLNAHSSQSPVYVSNHKLFVNSFEIDGMAPRFREVHRYDKLGRIIPRLTKTIDVGPVAKFKLMYT